jgi:hypothetical protein
MLGNSLVADRLAASQEGIIPIKSVKLVCKKLLCFRLILGMASRNIVGKSVL